MGFVVNRKELSKKAQAIALMFNGIARECNENYNARTKSTELNIWIQNKEERSIFIFIEIDNENNINMKFKIDCPEEDFLKAKQYIKNIPNDIFEKRNCRDNVGDFYVRVTGGKIYWGIDVVYKYSQLRNEERLALLFKDILEVIAECFYLKKYNRSNLKIS